jgi:hypothetical protein
MKINVLCYVIFYVPFTPLYNLQLNMQGTLYPKHNKTQETTKTRGYILE